MGKAKTTKITTGRGRRGFGRRRRSELMGKPTYQTLIQPRARDAPQLAADPLNHPSNPYPAPSTEKPIALRQPGCGNPGKEQSQSTTQTAKPCQPCQPPQFPQNPPPTPLLAFKEMTQNSAAMKLFFSVLNTYRLETQTKAKSELQQLRPTADPLCQPEKFPAHYSQPEKFPAHYSHNSQSLESKFPPRTCYTNNQAHAPYIAVQCTTCAFALCTICYAYFTQQKMEELHSVCMGKIQHNKLATVEIDPKQQAWVPGCQDGIDEWFCRVCRTCCGTTLYEAEKHIRDCFNQHCASPPSRNPRHSYHAYPYPRYPRYQFGGHRFSQSV